MERHMGTTIDYVIEAIETQKRHGQPQDYVTRDGMVVSHDDAIAILMTMQKGGMEYVLCCENVDAVGLCQGITS